MEEGWLCSLCNHYPAESFCFCCRSDTLLCRHCREVHFNKFPTRYHQNLPLSAYGLHRTPGYFERLQARIESIETGKNSLLLGLREVDECIEAFEREMNALMQRLWDYGQEKFAELFRVKADLEARVKASIEEAEATIYCEDMKFGGDFTEQLRTFSTDTPLKPFKYELSANKDLSLAVAFTYTVEAKKKETESKPLNPSASVWPCKCGYQYNVRGAEECLRCKHPNPLLPVVLRCPICKIREVERKDEKCEYCAQSKLTTKEDSNLWACIMCDVENNSNGEKCKKCNKRQEEVYPEWEKSLPRRI